MRKSQVHDKGVPAFRIRAGAVQLPIALGHGFAGAYGGFRPAARALYSHGSPFHKIFSFFRHRQAV